MRTEPKKPFNWGTTKSIYDKVDYKSIDYANDWTSRLLSEICNYAIIQKQGFFDVAYKYVNYKHEHLPSKLYKFFTCNSNSLNCLENQKVYLSTPNNFNDPFDCYLGINKDEFTKCYILKKIKELNLTEKGTITQQNVFDIYNSVCFNTNERFYWSPPKEFREIIRQWDYKSLMYEIYLEAWRLFDERIEKIKTQNLRVCSFTDLTSWQIENFTEMWAHYANNHRGFCVEYNLEKFKEKDSIDSQRPNCNNTVLGALFPCRYRAKPVVIPKSLLYKKILDEKMTSKQRVYFEKALIQAFITKSSSWSYEHEWRLILNNQFCNNYDNLIDFPYVSGVYLGSRMTNTDKENIFRIAKRINCKVYEGNCEENKFSLSFWEINIDEYFKDKQYYTKRKEYDYFSKC